jgi:hypothetical protein
VQIKNKLFPDKKESITCQRICLDFILVLLAIMKNDFHTTLNSKNTGDKQWHSWLRNCTTSQKVTGLIPDGVIGTFH